MFDDVFKVVECRVQAVYGGHSWHFTEEGHCVGCSCSVCGWYITATVLVVFHGWANVEPRGAVVSPHGLFLGTVMDDDFTTCWCQWSTVKIEVSVYLCIGR